MLQRGLLSLELHTPSQWSSGECPGWILIDRSGKHFGSILCYLRDGNLALPKGRQAVQELLAEAKYYLIQGLIELCQNNLQVRHVTLAMLHSNALGYLQGLSSVEDCSFNGICNFWDGICD